MISAGLHRDADIGTRQIDAAVRDHRSLRREIVEPLAGQNDHVSALAAAQTIQQRQRRREIGIDARSQLCFISVGQMANRSHQGQRREQANNVFHLQPFFGCKSSVVRAGGK